MRALQIVVVFVALIVGGVAVGMAAESAKAYQVTGKVVELTDAKIVVEKADGEKWEINRTADTKADGALKVGEKVTVFYTMTAKKVAVKEEAAGGEKKEENASSKKDK